MCVIFIVAKFVSKLASVGILVDLYRFLIEIGEVDYCMKDIVTGCVVANRNAVFQQV